MSPPRLTVSVVIPHLNQPGALACCLDSLASGSRQPDQVLVVDNGSRTPPEEICATRGARLLHEPTPGPGPARNTGAAAATGAILAFIDADCRADPGWVAALAARFERDPKVRILAGAVHVGFADPARPTATEAYERVYAYRMDRYLARAGFAATCNLAMRAEVLAAVGPFGGLAVAEDRDWGRRATAAGFDIAYLPEMRVEHPARSGFGETAAKIDRLQAHDFAELPPGLPARLKWLAKALALPPSCLAELPRLLRTTRLRGPRARLLAFAMLARVRAYRGWRMLRLLAGQDPARLTGGWNRPG